MRRLFITLVAVPIALVGFGTGAAHAQTDDVPGTPSLPPTEAPVAPPAGPSADPPDPATFPGDPEGWLCDFTGFLLGEIENNDTDGQAAPITGPLREQHAGFCSGDGGGDDDDPLAPLKEAVCPVIDTVLGEMGANSAPAELIGAVTTVRDAIGCPVDDPEPEGGGGGGGGTNTGGGGADGPDRSDVLGGGAQTGANGPLPRTGGELALSFGAGLTGLAALLRRFVLR